MGWVVRSVSTWLLVALAALLALQALPFTGIFLMIFGAGLLAGLMVHALLASIALEAIFGRLPRMFVLLPVALYGAYYAAYAWQGRQAAQMAAELREGNPGLLLQFEPERHALVMAQAGSFIQRYKIDVAYEANANFKPEGYLAHRLFAREDCASIPNDSQHRIQKHGLVRPFTGTNRSKSTHAVCVVRMPERPSKSAIEVEVQDRAQVWKRSWGISERITRIRAEGRLIGTYKTAHYWRLPSFPWLFLGCWLNSARPAWQCSADFMRKSEWISSVPAGKDQVLDAPVSVMLGIAKYGEDDPQAFEGYASNAEALERARNEAGRVQDEVFDQLSGMLSGQDIKPPHNMGYSLSLQPDKLGPLAKPMTELFITLLDRGVVSKPYRGEMLEMLGRAIPALPREAFAEVAGEIIAVAGSKDFWNHYPGLYLRAADVGPRGLPLYRDHVLRDAVKGWLRVLPVMAICRIGQADPELIERLKREFASIDLSKTNHGNEAYREALFVTLLKLREMEFAAQAYPHEKLRHAAWYETVLAGKGTTEVGPNNCAPRERNGWAVASSLAPSLKRTGQGWQVQ